MVKFEMEIEKVLEYNPTKVFPQITFFANAC